MTTKQAFYPLIGSLALLTLMTAGAVNVHADDVLTGNTTIDAQVTKGDLILAMDEKTDFGTQPLGDKIDFGTKDIAFTVTDFTGTTTGFTLTAQLGDTDAKRSLKVGGVELSETAVTVLSKPTNIIGENKEKVGAQLVYTNVNETKVFQTLVKWQLTNATTKDIAE
ncbi:hypothetical protein [Brochothrix campestris]|uniref:WxL domain-containing protein n=1 Tax=Brochothrix campestris FSL F6-1037 TaxID=1265861 RepID=W7D703_9LIST|nr:hypothetical protein [Brochothrix campestris]EUJ41143.1 hypothetical protein BCAMP_03985 [Brochothrix campestris FSL F6-1037]